MESSTVSTGHRRSGRVRGQINGGRSPIVLYALLRKHAAQLYALESGTPSMSHRQFAMSMNLRTTTCFRLRQFIRDHDQLVEKAIATNDWAAIEEELFGRFGSGFRLLDGYKRALALIGEGGGSEVRTKGKRQYRKKTAKADVPQPGTDSSASDGPEVQASAPEPKAAPAPAQKPPPITSVQDDFLDSIPVLAKAGAISVAQKRSF